MLRECQSEIEPRTIVQRILFRKQVLLAICRSTKTMNGTRTINASYTESCLSLQDGEGTDVWYITISGHGFHPGPPMNQKLGEAASVQWNW